MVEGLTLLGESTRQGTAQGLVQWLPSCVETFRWSEGFPIVFNGEYGRERFDLMTAHVNDE